MNDTNSRYFLIHTSNGVDVFPVSAEEDAGDYFRKFLEDNDLDYYETTMIEMWWSQTSKSFLSAQEVFIPELEEQDD